MREESTWRSTENLQRCYASCAQSVAGGTGGGCEELSMVRACGTASGGVLWLYAESVLAGSSSQLLFLCPFQWLLSHQDLCSYELELTWALFCLWDYRQSRFPAWVGLAHARSCLHAFLCVYVYILLISFILNNDCSFSCVEFWSHSALGLIL